MEKHNFAAYKPGTFSTDVSNLQFAEKFFEEKDMSAFVHEYCHYVQDITTISAIFGFSLWLRDVVALTKVFSNGEGKTISIPLNRDKYGETINKFRKYYNQYCGDPNIVMELDYYRHSFVKRHLSIIEIDLDGNIQKFAANEIELSNLPQNLFLGLIVLQEIHAFYAQQLAERKLPSVELSVHAEKLPSFPYKFGDFLFQQFEIEIDLDTKFILIELCLDTVQATSVFLEVLEKLKGKKIIGFGPDKIDLISIVEECRIKCSYSTEEALENIIPDLRIWSKEIGREHLSQAIGWYLNQIELVYNIKKLASPTFFSMPFCMDWYNFSLFFQFLPSPAYINNGIFYRTVSSISDEQDNKFIKNFEAATTIWSHRILYDLLCSENLNQINERCQCPLYEGCHIRPKIDEDYICKMTPWEIIKNKNKIICQYGMAAHSFGLWQNTLDIKIK
ncbi:MAG: hypothetical protein HYU68_00500 [Bacteroidetes bacterium]|nr:hypothetical protein [Bacteroidota bacterium]